MADESILTKVNVEQYVSDVLGVIDREREREIIARRFGLFDRKETLEQIGELLGITRERVRQLEKVVIARLKTKAEKNQLPHIQRFQDTLTSVLQPAGGIMRIQDLTDKIVTESGRLEQARISFLAQLCLGTIVLEDSDNYYHAVGLVAIRNEQQVRMAIDKIIGAIQQIGEPADIGKIAQSAGIKDTQQAAALASVSKRLATLNDRWGLIKWPMVNPKNIRDKIYVILKEQGKHMHFNEIADAIKQSTFKRKDVTTQAIHNELIKDKRFVLIGRGIYALKEWGYEKGTVADIISEVLRKAGEPLHRDEIVKRVLKSRYVKETTILLNLQGKSQFKRVAKATYALSE